MSSHHEPVPAEMTLLVRGRGPIIRGFLAWTAIFSVWALGALGVAISEAASKEDLGKQMVLSALSIAIVLTAVVFLTRIRRSGIYRADGVFQLRTPFGKMDLGSEPVKEFTLHDFGFMAKSRRMISVHLRDGSFVHFRYISWGNSLNALRYGGGAKIVPSKRQASVLSLLNGAATELLAEVKK